MGRKRREISEEREKSAMKPGHGDQEGEREGKNFACDH